MKSTAAQRRYIAALAEGAGPHRFRDLFNNAANLNQNRRLGVHETPTQATRRLTKEAASHLIEILLEAGIEPARVSDPYRKAAPFLEVEEPPALAPVCAKVPDELAND